MKKKKVLTLACVMIVLLFITTQSSLFSHPAEESKTKKSKIKKLSEMTLEELMNVKITTAGKTPERIGDIPASVVLITRKDIEIYGYRTLTEILENIPGLFAIDDYADFGANFGVRGFWSSQVNDNMIILVDGVHQVNDFLSNYPIDKIAVPVEAIDRIEVIRGPMSVVYGQGAFYGVINIITDKSINRAANRISGSIGSAKTKKLFARAAGREGDLTYVINASLYDTYGIDQPLSKLVQDPSILPILKVPETSRTGGKLEINEKYFNFSGSFKDITLNLSYNEAENEIYQSLPSVDPGSLYRNTTVFLSFGYRKEMSKAVTVEGKLSYSQSRDSYKYSVLSEDFYGVQQLHTNGFQVELNVFTRPGGNMDIISGLYYRSVFNASNRFNLPSLGNPSLENNYNFLADGDEIVTRALFTQINYKPLKNVKLVAGVRLEQSPKYEVGRIQVHGAEPPVKLSGFYDRDNIEVIPRFAAIYYLNDRNIFKFLYGKAINRPSFAQNYDNIFNRPDNPLEPESIQTLELNYISTISSRFTLNTSIFHNTLNNLITRVFIFDENQNYESFSANAGRMVTNGIELALNAEPFEDIRFELSGIYQKTEDKRPEYENRTVAYSPKFLGYFKASYQHDWFTLAVTGNYVGEMETYWDETLENPDGSFGNRIGEKVPGYFVLGANLRFEDIFMDGLYLNIRCSNLLDTEIRYPTFTINSWATRGTIGIGRTFLASVGFKF